MDVPRGWHLWFAWYPIKVEGSWVWGRLIEYCYMYSYDDENGLKKHLELRKRGSSKGAL